jgi:20S proteasome subunit beta 1
MALVYDKGVILGADSRTTSGTYVADRCSDKIDYVHDKICALRAGRASDTQTLCR